MTYILTGKEEHDGANAFSIFFFTAFQSPPKLNYIFFVWKIKGQKCHFCFTNLKLKPVKLTVY